MAGDWIKMRIDLQTHPKIVRILSATKSDKFRVVGGLHAVWGIFDIHSEDGFLKGYSCETMDHVIGWPGFSAALVGVGWIVETPEGIEMPEFSEHNGKSAKRRAEDQKRKRDARKEEAKHRTECGQIADKNRTREEKRREDIDIPVNDIVDLFNRSFPELPQVKLVNANRRKAVRGRWTEHKNMQTLEQWEKFFSYVRKSDFLMGRTSNPWSGLSFDWIMKSANMLKIIEGNYHADQH